MEAIVLAGGLGTRLGKVIGDLPKPMAPVAGRPFLEHVLQNLLQAGFARAILSVGYRAEAIRDHFGRSFGTMPIDYCVEDVPLGTGGAARLALSECRSDHAFILNGDTYAQVDFAAVERLWVELRQPVIVAREVDDTARFGRLSVEGGTVTAFSEKNLAGRGLINAGIYLLPVDALAGFAQHERFSLEIDYLQDAVRRRRFSVAISTGRFIDIGVPEDYVRAQTLFADQP